MRQLCDESNCKTQYYRPHEGVGKHCLPGTSQSTFKTETCDALTASGSEGIVDAGYTYYTFIFMTHTGRLVFRLP